MCVCVCVCVREREKERERRINILINITRLFHLLSVFLKYLKYFLIKILYLKKCRYTCLEEP